MTPSQDQIRVFSTAPGGAPAPTSGDFHNAILGCLLLDPVADGVHAVTPALESVGLTGAAPAVVFLEMAPRGLTPVAAWESPECRCHPLLGELSWVPAQLERGLAVVLSVEATGAPLEAGPDRDLLAAEGCAHALFLPLMEDGTRRHVLALFRPVDSPRFGQREIQFFQLAAAVLASSLKRLAAERAVAPQSPDWSRAQRLVTACRYDMEFGNDLELLPLIAEFLVERVKPWFPDENRAMSLKLGLVELLNNAVEHGNLAITGPEKVSAMERGVYPALLKERRAQHHLASRKVRVRVTRESDRIEWQVEDEGDGFDWKTRMETLRQAPDINAESGRGLFLCTHSFDVLQYLGRGNKVVAIARMDDAV